MKNVYQAYYQNDDTKGLSMNLYAYAPPAGPRLVVNGQELYIKNREFRTVERYQEYQNCGFNVLFGQHGGAYGDEPFEESGAKLILDRAYQAGIKKVILTDLGLLNMKLDKDGLIGEGKRFANEEEIDAFVKERMSAYINHPAFYGVQLKDEPRFAMLKSYGQLYRSIKRVHPHVFIQCNLMGMFFSFNNSIYAPYDDKSRFTDCYKRYLEAFLDETGADYLMMDQYGMYSGESEGLYRYHFLAYQIMTQIAKERGVKLMTVAQSYSRTVNGKPAERKPNEDEMFYQINSLLGFGMKELAYYTYWSGGDINFYGEFRAPDCAMVSMHGEITPLYYSVQKVNAMIQKLAPVILNFEHKNDTYAVQNLCKSKPMHLEHTLRGQLQHAKLSNNQEVTMAFELYDKIKEQYLYVVENITCPKFGKDLPDQTSTLTFTNSAWTKVDVFDENEWHTEDLVNGTYTVTLKNGHAVYVLPHA